MQHSHLIHLLQEHLRILFIHVAKLKLHNDEIGEYLHTPWSTYTLINLLILIVIILSQTLP